MPCAWRPTFPDGLAKVNAPSRQPEARARVLLDQQVPAITRPAYDHQRMHACGMHQVACVRACGRAGMYLHACAVLCASICVRASARRSSGREPERARARTPAAHPSSPQTRSRGAGARRAGGAQGWTSWRGTPVGTHAADERGQFTGCGRCNACPDWQGSHHATQPPHLALPLKVGVVDVVERLVQVVALRRQALAWQAA